MPFKAEWHYKTWPKLKTDKLIILNDKSDWSYNCIGHALGLHKWIDAQNNDLSQTVQEFKERGYTRETKRPTKVKKEKVALYGRGQEVLHAIRFTKVKAKWYWTSKNGATTLIAFNKVKSLESYDYGKLLTVLERE